MARPRKFDEVTVLRAVRDQFWSTGYAGTSVDDVLAATGLGKGSLYGAFGDKHQLFVRVFDGYCTEVVDQVRKSLEGPDSTAFERLRAHVVAVAAGSDLRGCLLAKGTTELAGQDADVTTRARRAFEELEDLLTRCVTQAQRHGDIAPDADPRALAGLLLAVLRGIEALGKAGKTSLHEIAETALAVLPR
ncbi:TetR/AcrR family transcriptional regulator [Lentzea tibetensis]|uniref:TetR/AcrR family transcriptional regulator n=1 Tax=Lentzea tibetensis TaxID=2591470 RepID=A0A563ELI0_9PSEU|nr:TetR/AcrR family transcriptional regulator [Lentzea tibetensis]TWP48008.1 TetR/AcrR family transcriptional regulator [Lentzea tibetensis]